VIVDNLDLVSISIPPLKANPPLIVDPQTPLPFPVAPQRFQPIGGRLKKLLQPGNPVNLPQLAKRYPLKGRISPAVAMVEDLLGI
jgi:hypothetical protein